MDDPLSTAARSLSSHLDAGGASCRVGAGDGELVVYAPNHASERKARVVVGGTFEGYPVKVVRTPPARPAT